MFYMSVCISIHVDSLHMRMYSCNHKHHDKVYMVMHMALLLVLAVTPVCPSFVCLKFSILICLIQFSGRSPASYCALGS